jgi:two-component system, NarL family, sensor kinase
MSSIRVWIILILCSLVAPAICQDAYQLLQKAQGFHMQNRDSCIYFSDLVINQADTPKQDSLIAQALFLKGWNIYLQAKYTEAIQVFKTLLKHPGSSENQLQYIRAAGRIGTSFRELGTYDSAMYYLQQYDKLVDKHLGETVIEAKLELGELYRMMGRLEVSNAYKLEAIQRARLGGSRMDKMMALYYYLDDNSNNPGNLQYQKYLDEYLELIGKRRIDGTVDYSHSGTLLMRFSGDEKLALLESDVESLDSSGRGKGYIILNQHLVNEYIGRKNYQAAQRHALNGLESAEARNEVGFILDYQKLLAQIADKSGHFQQAYQYINSYYILKDSLFTVAAMANVDSLRIQFETAKKEKQLANQELQLQHRTHQRNLLFAGLAIFIWFGAFAIFYLINRNRINHKLALQETEIQEQHIQQLEQEKQLLAMNSMIEGQEAERMRIARDLHDGLGGLLGTVKAHFSVIQEEIEKLEAIKMYKEVDKLIDTASAEVRRISHNMAPQALRFGGLNDALYDLTKQLKTHGLTVNYEWSGPQSRLPETVEVMLYRIVQELTHNTVKYAHAKSLLIQVIRYDDQLNLIVEDDGVGFDATEAFKQGGLGLRSVQSRIDYINGALDIDSTPGDGTTISIQLDLGNYPSNP